MMDTDAPRRDLYLINGFWGETFRQWFTDFCVRSLLAPGNLSALDAGANNKFLLATTEEDWQAVQRHPAVVELQKHYEIVFYPIPSLDDRAGVRYRLSTYEHVARAYAPLLQRAYEDKALGLMLSPDLMLSESMLPALRRRVDKGANLVFVPAWRSDETQLMAFLRAELGENFADASFAAKPLVADSRMLAAAMVRSVHELEKPRFWSEDRFCDWPSYTFWPIEGNGYVIFGMSGVPFVDYAQVAWHDLRFLGPASLDAYPTMFGFDEPRVEVIADTDEAAIASWTPSANEAWTSFPRRWRLRIPGFRDFARCAILRAYAQHVFFWGKNRLNQAVYAQPIRLHVRDIDEDWLAVERRASGLVAKAVGDMFAPGAFGRDVAAPVGKRWNPWWCVMQTGTLVFAWNQVVPRNLHYLKQVALVLKRAIAGNPEDRRRVARRMSGLMRRILARFE
jgi:hypothetical protein